MPKDNTQFTLLDTEDALVAFAALNKNAPWMAFDTEFIGEKRFETLLCLIQVVTPLGVYLIDPLKVSNIHPFLELIVNPAILKITHSGENDYRLLNTAYDIIPKNIFDTQIAAGFVGYPYPISFLKLVEKEAGVELNKSYSVTDWETRPFKSQQLLYALNDVIYLYDLWQSLSDKLNELNRFSWAQEEMSRLESYEYYDRDPHKEALTNTLMHSLKTRKRIFLLRLYEWRREEARRLNFSKEMVLPSKLIGPIVKSIDSGKQALVDNRIIPPKIIREHWDSLYEMYQKPAREDELQLLEQIPASRADNPEHQLSMELLYLLIKFKCFEEQVAHTLVINKSNLNNAETDLFPENTKGWRKEFLGAELIHWITDRGNIRVDFSGSQVIIRMENETD